MNLAEERARVGDEDKFFGMLGAIANLPHDHPNYYVVIEDLIEQAAAFRSGEAVLLAFAEQTLGDHALRPGTGLCRCYSDWPCRTVRRARECGIEVPDG